MTPDDVSPGQAREIAGRLMRRQAQLGLRLAAVFLLVLLGLPLINLYLPDLAGQKVGGFSATWLFLGILFYPLTWILSFAFVKRSDAIEDELAAEVRTTMRSHAESEAGI